jgi:hypothetical protein
MDASYASVCIVGYHTNRGVYAFKSIQDDIHPSAAVQTKLNGVTGK